MAKLILTKQQATVIGILKKKVPQKELGIKIAYYRIPNKNSLDFLFIVDEDRAILATGYIRSLFSSLEKSLKDIEIDVSIHIYEKKKVPEVERMVEKENYFTATLVHSFV